MWIHTLHDSTTQSTGPDMTMDCDEKSHDDDDDSLQQVPDL